LWESAASNSFLHFGFILVSEFDLHSAHKQVIQPLGVSLLNRKKGKTMDVFLQNYRNVKIIESIFGVLFFGSLLLFLYLPKRRNKK